MDVVKIIVLVVSLMIFLIGLGIGISAFMVWRRKLYNADTESSAHDEHENIKKIKVAIIFILVSLPGLVTGTLAHTMGGHLFGLK